MISIAFWEMFFLCWGSFLNVIAYRLFHFPFNICKQSQCVHCHRLIAWYDLIPVISWLFLKGRCRSCKKSISWLYPFIELYTGVVMLFLYLYIPSPYCFAYFIFFSALLIATRTDLETMLISRFTSLFLVPLGWIASIWGLVPIGLLNSIAGAILGYGILYIINQFSLLVTGRQGIGEGDNELLAYIGSFLGIQGCWTTLFISSVSGAVLGYAYMFWTGADRTLRIPFAPFLALGAIVSTFLLFI